jgi:hypothetical protein
MSIIRSGAHKANSHWGLVYIYIYIVGTTTTLHGETIQRPSRSAMSIDALTKNYKLVIKVEQKSDRGGRNL